MPGPLQVIAVSFGPGADFEGRVLAEVDRFQGRGVLRLLDVLFVAKSDDGVVEKLIVGDDEDFGALLASIVPLDGAGLVGDGSRGSIRLTHGHWQRPWCRGRHRVPAHRTRLGTAAGSVTSHFVVGEIDKMPRRVFSGRKM